MDLPEPYRYLAEMARERDVHPRTMDRYTHLGLRYSKFKRKKVSTDEWLADFLAESSVKVGKSKRRRGSPP